MSTTSLEEMLYYVRSAILVFVAIRGYRAVLQVSKRLPWVWLPVGFLFLSLIWSQDPIPQLRGLLGLAASVAVCLVLVSNPKSLFWGVIGGSFVIFCVAALVLIGSGGDANAFNTRRGVEFRGQRYATLIGKSNLPIAQSAGIAIALIGTFGLATRRASRLLIFMLLAAVAFLVAARSATFAVASTLSLLSAVIAYLSGKYSHRIRALMGILLFGLAGVSLLILAPNFLFSAALGLTGRTDLSGREDLWQNALRLHETRPLLGYGLAEMASPHSLYLQVLLAGGLLAAFAFALVLLIALGRAWMVVPPLIPTLVLVVVASSTVSNAALPGPLGIVMLWSIISALLVRQGSELFELSTPTDPRTPSRMRPGDLN